MKRKYVIVRSGSTRGPYIVERNSAAPHPLIWSLAHIAGYASTLRDAERRAREANNLDKRSVSTTQLQERRRSG